MIIFFIFLFLLSFFFLCHLLLTLFCFFFAVNIYSSTFFKMFFFISAAISPLFFLLPRFLLFLPFSYFLVLFSLFLLPLKLFFSVTHFLHFFLIFLILSNSFHSFSFLLFLSHNLGAMSDWLSKRIYTKEASTCVAPSLILSVGLFWYYYNSYSTSLTPSYSRQACKNGIFCNLSIESSFYPSPYHNEYVKK